jgi:hypothetical protein
LNNYIAAEVALQLQKDKQALLAEWEAAANGAWSARGKYKSSLCGNLEPPVKFIPGEFPKQSPVQWDATEDLYSSFTPVNLNCANSGTAIDLSAQTDAARLAEQQKYCTVGSADYDSTMCALFSGSSAPKSEIRGTDAIIDAVIDLGITR